MKKQKIEIENKNIWIPFMEPKEYYNIDYLGASKLKSFYVSGKNYLAYKNMPDTPSLRYGRMVHKFILEEEDFNKEYKKIPLRFKNKRTKEYKDWSSKQKKELITHSEFKELEKIKTALLDSYAAKYFDNIGLPETSMFWNHHTDYGAINCKGRIDFLIPSEDEILMVDYKTIQDANKMSCLYAMKNYMYWLQEAHYISGYEKIIGKKARMIFVFQEIKEPYDVCVVKATDEAVFIAKQKYEQTMQDLAMAHYENKFLGKNQETVFFDFY